MQVRRFIAMAAVGLALFLPGTVAQADSVKIPFTDRNVVGALTFCDKNNHEVRSGKITDIPFVAKYVSSAPAPKGYFGPLGKSFVLVVQPREGVDPGLWNGVSMTGSAHYASPEHPATVATYGDRPLIDFTGVAPLWQGLAQVRMYFTNVNMQPHNRTYPAAIIRVSGSSWSLVQGGGGSCGAGSAVSSETILLGPSQLPSASPTYSAVDPSKIPAPVIVGGDPSEASSSGVAGGGTSTPSPSASGATVAVASSGNVSVSSSSMPLIIAAVIGLPLLGALAGAFLVRRKASTSLANSSGDSGAHPGA